MQVDISGSWIYVYSGSIVQNDSEPEERDPFSCVRCISTHAVTELLFDEKDNTIRIGVGPSFVYIEFGSRPDARIDAYRNTKEKLLDVMDRWGIDRRYAENLDRRNPLTAAQRTRADDQIEFVD
jgi:hypothetical protein